MPKGCKGEEIMMNLVRRNEEDLFDGLLTPSRLFDEAIGTLFGNESIWNPNRWARESSLYPMNVVRVKKDGKSVAQRLEYALAGFTKDEIKVTLKDDTLLVEAEHKPEENKDEEAEYNGISYKKMSCQYQLTDDADKEAVACAFKDGLLTITVPFKKEEEKPVDEAKRIDIQ
jgi:HSP20 family protein